MKGFAFLSWTSCAEMVSKGCHGQHFSRQHLTDIARPLNLDKRFPIEPINQVNLKLVQLKDEHGRDLFLGTSGFEGV